MNGSYDVAVVGAGILGLAHAYALAKRGLRVVVLERDRRAQGASIRNFGMIWPIGQPLGEMHQLASHSRELWFELLKQSGLWHDPCGSLHLAYHDDEWAVLNEFINQAYRYELNCSLLSPREISSKYPAIVPDHLRGGLWSPTEVTVDPRQVIGKLPEFLHQTYGIDFEWDVRVLRYEHPQIVTTRDKWLAKRLVICAGIDFRDLLPTAFAETGMLTCKLQMMRSQAFGGAYQVGTMLAAGLTLRHYQSFAQCATLPALIERLDREQPLYHHFGIHVLVSQNGLGEVILGDSHEYDDDVEPFDKPQIDELVLKYLRTFLRIPDLHIAARWHGLYAKHPSQPYVAVCPDEHTLAVTGVGGAGMTLSMGLADKLMANGWRTLMFELVVFDMAGTTVKDADEVRDAFRGALAQHKIKANEERITTVMGLHKPEAIQLLLAEAGQDTSKELVDVIHEDFVRRMLDHYAHDPQVGEIPGASSVFAQLRQAGIKVALNTGFSRQIVDVLLKRLGWQAPATIDASITSDEVPRGRPFPDMIQQLMQRLKISDARKVVKVGDTWADLQEGTGAGCGMVIGVTSGSYTQEQLARQPHTHIVRSIVEVPALVLDRS